MSGRSLLKGIGLGGAAVAVGAWSSTARGRRADEAAFRAANASHGPVADLVYAEVTELGSWWAAGAAAAALALAGERRAAARGLAGASVTWLAGQGLKQVFLRPRPYDADPGGTRLMIGRPRGTSWPSSHPAVLVAFLSIVQRDLHLGTAAGRALDALGNVVGASRVYLGVHYPSDVAGGILLGRAIAELFANGG